VAWFFWALFINSRYATVFGLSKVLLGTVSILGYPWNAIDPIIIALPLSAITILVLQYGRGGCQPETQAA
jgi:SSS family solute:Na+ symporter